MEMRNTDAPVGIEELAHMGIVSAIIHQLTKDLTPEEIAASGFVVRRRGDARGCLLILYGRNCVTVFSNSQRLRK